MLNLVDELAGGDILRWEKIMRMDNHTIYLHQARASRVAKINRRLEKIKEEKLKARR